MTGELREESSENCVLINQTAPQTRQTRQLYCLMLKQVKTLLNKTSQILRNIIQYVNKCSAWEIFTIKD